jgi:hypothetical protein
VVLLEVKREGFPFKKAFINKPMATEVPMIKGKYFL